MDPYLPLLTEALKGGLGLVALLAAVALVGYFMLRVHPQTVGAMTEAGRQIADAGREMAAGVRDAAAVQADAQRRDRKQLRAWLLRQEATAQERHTELLQAVQRRPTDPEGHR